VSLNQPDLDLIADYVGGALDGTPDEQRVGDRIRSDAEWARAYADLTAAFGAVSSDLRAFGATPERMPDDVWAGLEAALSSASTAPNGEFASGQRPKEPPTFTAPRDNRPPSRHAARRRRWATPVVAAIAVLFALSLTIFALKVPTRNFGDSGSTGADAPAAVGGAPVLQRASGRDYTDETLVLATDFGVAYAASAGGRAATAEDSAKAPQVAPSYAAPVPPALSSLTIPSNLGRCLDAVTAIMPGQVLGVDYATYERTPAVIVVVRTPDDSRWVGVAAADCGNGGAHLLAQKRLD